VKYEAPGKLFYYRERRPCGTFSDSLGAVPRGLRPRLPPPFCRFGWLKFSKRTPWLRECSPLPDLMLLRDPPSRATAFPDFHDPSRYLRSRVSHRRPFQLIFLSRSLFFCHFCLIRRMILSPGDFFGRSAAFFFQIFTYPPLRSAFLLLL